MILVDTSQTQKVKSKSVLDMDFSDQAQCTTTTEIASLLDLTPMGLLSGQVPEDLNSLYTKSPGFLSDLPYE